jgi:hypothetical protein
MCLKNITINDFGKQLKKIRGLLYVRKIKLCDCNESSGSHDSLLNCISKKEFL